jgi:hypothetical protein
MSVIWRNPDGKKDKYSTENEITDKRKGVSRCTTGSSLKTDSEPEQ